MSAKRAEKEKVVEGLKTEFKNANAIFISDYRGIEALKLTALRFELNKTGAKFKVIKNRMALRALDKPLADSLKTQIDDTTAFTILKGDAAAGAKVLTKFAKDNDKLKIRAGILDGKVLSLADVKALSALPSRQELLGKFVCVLNAVPTGFVRVLNAVPNGWVNVLESLRKKKEQG